MGTPCVKQSGTPKYVVQVLGGAVSKKFRRLPQSRNDRHSAIYKIILHVGSQLTTKAHLLLRTLTQSNLEPDSLQGLPAMVTLPSKKQPIVHSALLLVHTDTTRGHCSTNVLRTLYTLKNRLPAWAPFSRFRRRDQ